MKFSTGEKKMLAFCVVAIALPLSVGVYLNRSPHEEFSW